ncbi:helix-turn-helix domain-containing protein [Halalkalicoccus salilacus]|uniref:helix-turn-helix domain-containing protein n=1 Tax=Halalkalicoccus salilacus TaxID=3117459 RepID=UPI00300F5356
MHDFLVDSDTMNQAELHAWNLSREDVQFALFYIDGDIDAYRDRIDGVNPIQWYELTPVDETGFYSYVCQEYTESETAFFQAFAELSLVVVPPMVYSADGWLDMTIVGRGEALTDLVDALEQRAGIGVDVREIGTYDRRLGTVTGSLTERQFEAIETATEMGYYSVPRQASLSAVAAELGVASSTASELLRCGESRLMSRLIGSSNSFHSLE